MSTKTKNKSNNNNGNNNRPAAEGDTVPVLYQKMGDRWFAFSLIDDEVFVGSITQEEIDAAESRAAKSAGTFPKSGNS